MKMEGVEEVAKQELQSDVKSAAETAKKKPGKNEEKVTTRDEENKDSFDEPVPIISTSGLKGNVDEGPEDVIGGDGTTLKDTLKKKLSVTEKERIKKELEKAATPIDLKDTAFSIIVRPELYFFVIFMSAWLLGHFGFNVIWVVFMAVALLVVQIQSVIRQVQKRVIHHANAYYDNPNPEKESLYWVNNLIKTIWTNFPKTMEEQIMVNANAQMSANKPAFLDDLRMDSVVVGKYYPELKNFRVWNESAETLKFDCEMDYESDLKVTVNIVRGITIPIKIKNLTIKCALRLFVRFLPNDERYVCYAWVSLLEPLEIDLSVQILGIDITEVPFVMWAVRRMIRDVSNEVALVPNRIGIDLAAIQGFTPSLAQLKPHPRPENYSSMVGTFGGALGAIGKGGFDLCTGVGGAGISAIKGVGGAGVSVVKGVGGAGMGAMKGVGNVGSSLIGNASKKEKKESMQKSRDSVLSSHDEDIGGLLLNGNGREKDAKKDKHNKNSGKRSTSFSQRLFGHGKDKDKKDEKE
eukprot:CFRG6744T1